MGDRLIEFFGTECVHCRALLPMIERLEKEEKVKITRIEVWHNAQNAKLMQSYDKDEKGNIFCGGVPFLVNEKTGKKLCGVPSYDKLKAWALGK